MNIIGFVCVFSTALDRTRASGDPATGRECIAVRVREGDPASNRRRISRSRLVWLALYDVLPLRATDLHAISWAPSDRCEWREP
jgi:hypothetical protein